MKHYLQWAVVCSAGRRCAYPLTLLFRPQLPLCLGVEPAAFLDISYPLSCSRDDIGSLVTAWLKQNIQLGMWADRQTDKMSYWMRPIVKNLNITT